LSGVSECKKQPKQVGYTPEIRKKLQPQSGMIFYDMILKNSGIIHKFKSRFPILNFKSRSRIFW